MAGARGTYEAKLEDADSVIRHFEAEELLGKPIRRVFSRVGLHAKGVVKGHAPRLSGRLGSSVTSRMGGRQVPTFVAVVVKAKSARGFSYPRLLEFSPKHNHKEWLLQAFNSAIGGVRGVINEIAHEVEAAFK